MKEKDDKLKLVKQILVSDEEATSIEGKQELRETVPMTIDNNNDDDDGGGGGDEVPTTSRATTITGTTIVPETIPAPVTTPKTSTKTASTVKFDDTSDVRLSRKVNTSVSVPYYLTPGVL